MTGYGKASAEFQGKKITAEAKSLNSKALDLSTRIAPLYREKELELRAMIAQTLERGKVDFSLWIEQEDTAGATQLNGPLIESYRRQIRHICDVYSIPQPADWWATLLRMPDVTARPESQELSDEEWAVVKQLTEDVIGQLMEFRRQEGAALEKKFSEKLDNIESLLQSIEPYEKERTARIRQRIIDSLQTIPEVETEIFR